MTFIYDKSSWAHFYHSVDMIVHSPNFISNTKEFMRHKKAKIKKCHSIFLLIIVALLTIKKKILRFIIFKLVPASNTMTTDMGFFTIVHRILKIFLLLLCSPFYRGFKVNAYAIFFLICHLKWILIFELF